MQADSAGGASGAVTAAPPATCNSTRLSRCRSRSASATLLRVMVTSQPPSVPRRRSKLPRLRQADTKACWVTSSASGLAPRERNAML
jgi:hypothetical protein